MKKLIYILLITSMFILLTSCNQKKDISKYSDKAYILDKEYKFKNVIDFDTLEKVDISKINDFPLNKDTKFIFTKTKGEDKYISQKFRDIYLKILNFNKKFKIEDGYKIKQNEETLFHLIKIFNYNFETKIKNDKNFQIILGDLKQNKSYIYLFEVDNV